MASFAVKKAFNVAPTVRTRASGVPLAPLVNLAAKAPADGHGHGEAARSDAPLKWAGGISRTSSGLVSKTFFNGKEHFFRANIFFNNRLCSSAHHYFPTASPPYLCRRQRCT